MHPREEDEPAGVTLTLIRRVLNGDSDAWSSLCAFVHPWATQLCVRRGYTRPLRHDDAAESVALLTIERLKGNNFRPLQRYAETCKKYPTTDFERWLAVLVHNVFIDYLRSRPEVRRRRDGGQRRLEHVDIAPLHDAHTVQPETQSRQIEVSRILGHLRDNAFPATGRAAILLWLAGHSTEEIAIRLHLANPHEAKKLLHASRQRLRRAVREREKGQE